MTCGSSQKDCQVCCMVIMFGVPGCANTGLNDVHLVSSGFLLLCITILKLLRTWRKIF
jgi:hypothetical protein